MQCPSHSAPHRFPLPLSFVCKGSRPRARCAFRPVSITAGAVESTQILRAFAMPCSCIAQQHLQRDRPKSPQDGEMGVWKPPQATAGAGLGEAMWESCTYTQPGQKGGGWRDWGPQWAAQDRHAPKAPCLLREQSLILHSKHKEAAVELPDKSKPRPWPRNIAWYSPALQLEVVANKTRGRNSAKTPNAAKATFPEVYASPSPIYMFQYTICIIFKIEKIATSLF